MLESQALGICFWIESMVQKLKMTPALYQYNMSLEVT